MIFACETADGKQNSTKLSPADRTGLWNVGISSHISDAKPYILERGDSQMYI